MKNTCLNNLLTILLLLSYCNSSFAKLEQRQVDEQAVIKQFTPPEFTAVIDEDGKPYSFGNGIGGTSAIGKLDKTADQYMVIAYHMDDPTKGPVCKLVTLKIKDGTAKPMGDTQNQINDEIGECYGVEIVSASPNNFVLLQSSAGRSSSDFHIFTWNGTNLVNSTPIEKNSYGYDESAFTSRPTILSNGSETILIAKPFQNLSDDENSAAYQAYQKKKGTSPKEATDAYSISKDGKIQRISSADFIDVAEKKKNRAASIQIFNTKSTAATYVLEMKNLSSSSRAARAEVWVDENLVLKPLDFCNGPQPPKSDKTAWSGKDDSDDNDEDHLKRCPPKKDVYAIVKTKKDSVLKVKVFGPGGSQLQVSLRKK